MPFPGEVIHGHNFETGRDRHLPEATVERLGHELVGFIDDVESDHHDKFDAIDVHWDWYEAKPLVERRSEPWPNASNIVVPIIRTASDAIMARFQGRLHTPTRTWVARSLNEEFKEPLPKLVDHINWASRNLFDVQAATQDWISEMVPLGDAVLQLAWQERRAFRWAPGSRPDRPRPVEVTIARGPSLQHVPREQVLWQKDRTIKESEFVIRQSLATENDMILGIRGAGWLKEAVDMAFAQPGIDGRQGTILQSKREREGVQSTTMGQADDLHDIRDVWIELPLALLMAKETSANETVDGFDPKDETPIPIVVTIHPQSRQILRVVAHPYFFGRWPFYDIYLRKRAGRGSSPGIAKMLEHVQRGVTTMVNQAIDSVTFANSLNYVTTDGRLKNQRWSPSMPLKVDNINDVTFPNIPKGVQPDIAMTNLLTAIGERLTGIADPALGRETRLGGHPSPATSTLVQLQEASRLFNMTLRQIRQQTSHIGEDIASMFQQYETDEEGRLTAIHGEADAEAIRSIILNPDIPISGAVQFDLHSMSEQLNPETAFQQAITTNQVVDNYWTRALNMLQVLTNPQAPPPLKKGAMDALKAATASMKRALISIDIDDVEEFIMELDDERSGDLAGIQQFLQQQQQAQQAQQQQQQQGGNGAGQPGGGAPGQAQQGQDLLSLGPVASNVGGAGVAPRARSQVAGSGFNL